MTKLMSYEEFWDNLNYIDINNISSRNVFLEEKNRSSTIFPIFRDNSTKTTIHYLSYWLKKHGNNVVARYTLRDLEGHTVTTTYEAITSCKAYTKSVSDLFIKEQGFCGSVEVEFFSKNPPHFTFPAVTVCYDGEYSSSVVHSCIRTYNKGEVVRDYALMFPQTGFDVEFCKSNKNFVCFFGGNSKIYNIDIFLIEGDHKKNYQLKLKNNRYGEMHVIWLEDIILKYGANIFTNPKCIIHHDFVDVFPRFYVGMKKNNYAPTMTHTFFDTSKAEEIENSKKLNLRAKNHNSDDYFDVAFSIPAMSTNAFETVIRSYGQNLEFFGTALVLLHSLSGDLIYSRNLTKQEMRGLCGESSFELNKFLLEAKVEPDNNYCVRFAFCNEKNPFPRRFKLGLNVRRKGKEYGSNICFSPSVIFEGMINKPFNRRWFPIGGKQKFVATYHNTDLKKIDTKVITECKFEFFNHRGETLLRLIEVAKNGSVFIDTKKDRELKNFLGDDGGWCMVNSNTYMCDAYFFALADDQIGGDHAY